MTYIVIDTHSGDFQRVRTDHHTSLGRDTETALNQAFERHGIPRPPAEYVLHAAEVLDALSPPSGGQSQIHEGVVTG